MKSPKRKGKKLLSFWKKVVLLQSENKHIMIKRFFILLLAALLGVAQAQNSMAVPYGSFEQWTTHPGYDVNAGFLSMPVYDSFAIPNGWNHLEYPVNQSVSLGFQTITINTMMPLIVAGHETASVPHGNAAVKLQTFMLTDIINPLVYSMASGMLDTTMTNMVYPSVLATGTVNVEHFIPIMSSLMANMDSLEAMLVSLADMDVNYLITGGIALGDFVPTSLTGYYKYHSAVSGDNGGVLILGTHYNSTLNKRELVGGGVNIALTDCEAYLPFTVDYMSLHEYDTSYAEQAPDSLIVMLVSSASLNRQQGSYLCIDSLNLWHVDPPLPPEPPTPVEPDTCAIITNITLDSSNIVINNDSLVEGYVATWESTFAPQAWELEYGLEGFATGSGTAVTVLASTYTFGPLQPGTQYELRVRTVCNDSVYGEWVSLVFLTRDTIPAPVTGCQSPLSPLNVQLYPNPAHGCCTVDLPADAELSLYTVDGRLLHTTHGQKVTIELPSAGIFLLKVTTPHGTLTRKLVNQ